MPGLECPEGEIAIRLHKFIDTIDCLKKKAMWSDLRYKHSASLIKGDKIISIGINRFYKEILVNNKTFKLTIHAEIDALSKADCRILKGMDIIVIRVDKTLNLKNSRPCDACIEKLRKKGIRKVYYSNTNGNIVYEFLDDMPQFHISSGIKNKL